MPDLAGATNGTTSATQSIRILQAPKPITPESARQRGEEGVVMLRIHVTAQGVADDVRVQQSSGSRRLDEAARTTVQQQWRFAPAERHGIKIAAETIQQIEFRLSD
ncbi:energy transducer TonB [Silvimonas sp.]|uniref:energy transducer TonB n=1 Tax=Silvimonas sp. TaxID=2650811 RepID=UPI0028465748|nr:energy transducer TonB [Silvimonas sp.]MDR3425999.1 energy transducer TonB [Silvimonas sp.]